VVKPLPRVGQYLLLLVISNIMTNIKEKPKNRADFTHYLKTGHRKHGARRSAGKSKLYEQRKKKQ
jgi:hypothetical protein